MATTTEELSRLLKKACSGNGEAMQVLCCRLDHYIRGYFAANFRNAALVDDLCQETHIQILKNLPNIRKPIKLKSYVAKVAFHVKQDYFRDKYRKSEISLEDHFDMPDCERLSQIEPDQEANHFDTILNRVDLEYLLSELPEKSRSIIALKTSGYNYDEIAKKMHLSLSGVKMQIKRSFAQIKAKMQDVTFFF